MTVQTGNYLAGASHSQWGEVLHFADELITALLARMQSAREQGDHERALQWAHTATGLIVFGGTFGRLASLELEQATVAMAQTLPGSPIRRNQSGPKRFLHVLTEAYELFGHTKLCRRWIEIDPTSARHDVVLLAQRDQAPTNLRHSVEARGGKLTRLDRTQPLLKRAQQLRELAYAEADVVVLHVHPFDLLPNVAFGISGGPPVVYVNHADHEFWVGGAVADLVLDIRESGQEWTRALRAIPRTQILPIPLEEDPILLGGPESVAALRREVRQSLGVNDDEMLLLTIGSARKYLPMQGLSFLEAAEHILQRCPKAKIVAVGPKPVAEWQAVSQRTGGRLLAVGNQSDLGRFHAAADLYLEGMPAGSLTALLEVCLAGVPCVRAPAQVRPPHSSDGSAFASVEQPESVAAYVDEVVALVNQPATRRTRGERLQRQVRDTHCEGGWSKLLAEIVSALPQVHSTYPDQSPQPISLGESEFKLEYAYQRVPQALQGLVATFVQQAVRNCTEARRVVEKILADSLVKSGELAVRGEILFGAILPELRGKLPAGAEQSTLDGAGLAKELMEFAAEEGRRLAAWRLGVRLTKECPSIWQQSDFQKGMAKSLPGMLTLVEMRKSLRK